MSEKPKNIPELIAFLSGSTEVRSGSKFTALHLTGMEGARLVESWSRLEGFSVDELKTLRAKINGKISKRSISPEAQAKMQAARKKKKRNALD